MVGTRERRQEERRRRSGRTSGAGEVYAAVDLGTNNCRLLVARPSTDGFRVIDAFSRIVRLGEGLSAQGRLTEAAIVRTLEALKICAQKMERRGVTQVRAVATEACRQARNCESFVERVRHETGVELEIISNSEEASLGLYGCTPLLADCRPYAIIFDIGGGSTEVSWLRVRRATNGRGVGRRNGGGRYAGNNGARRSRQSWIEPERLEWCSQPVGVVTLAESYGGFEISEQVYEAMVADVMTSLAPFERAHGLGALIEQGAVQMLGTSGTVTTLSGIDKGLPRYDRSKVDGSYLTYDSVLRLCQSVAAMSYEERRQHPCIGSERADLVVAGCAILEAICRTWPVPRLRVADRGLREGILFNLIKNGQGPEAPASPHRPCAAALSD